MFKIRDDEPQYAYVPDVNSPRKNQWGKDIELLDVQSELAGRSLNINGDSSVGDNPNRYKQHGFHFTADNCIGCHACEAACSQKNDLPAHISFRSVGYIEGGCYPAYKRLNISMACNHCDNPVCLKGCPTRAYTKYAEYGAVLQDPDICFGCGYCTWVCPYNAPQLDPIKGQVSKCNMCVDRLEVGLKPACAAACLGGALDFGIIETTPENRDQTKVSIPGFPTPQITNPNIRFQQVKSLPREMTRADSMPIKYQRDEQGQGEFNVKVNAANNKQRLWSLGKLRSREDPLVLFTLITQGVVGAFLLLFLGPLAGLEVLSRDAHPALHSSLLFSLVFIQAFALAISTMHLGKPHRFYRAFNNLKYSPVSREVAAVAVSFNLLIVYSLLSTFPTALDWAWAGATATFTQASGWLLCVFGPLSIYAMHKIYRIPARPYWNHWQVLSSFFGNMLSLGAVIIGLSYLPVLALSGAQPGNLLSMLTLVAFLGVALESLGLYAHARYLQNSGAEAAASAYRQATEFGKTYASRNTLLGLLTVALPGLLLLSNSAELGLQTQTLSWMLLACGILLSAVLGRCLFYVLVIPTTMPGAFFWKNAGFQEHARESGLAQMPQTGVLPHTEYHDLQKQRIIEDLKGDWQRYRQKGLKQTLSRGWKLVFNRG